MGMDGLSFSNSGIIQDKTSADLANKTEQSIKSDALTNSQQVQNINTHKRVQEKEESEEQGKKNKQSPKDEEFKDGLVTKEDVEKEIAFDIEDIESGNKDFYVKLNAIDDIIELYDSSTNKLVETISGNELGELVQKLNMASGIFVNKKV